jgi:putative transposase
MAEIVEAKIFQYRDRGAYLVHRYVVLPDHLHIIITPGMTTTLEKAMGLIKGGSSFDIGKAVAMKFPVWHEGFAEHQIDNQDDYATHVRYIDANPVKAGLVREPSEYSHCSLNGKYPLDPWPVAPGAEAPSSGEMVTAGLKPRPSVPFSRKGDSNEE